MLHVTERSVRRYLDELGRLTELESIPTTPGGPHLWRIKPSERGRAIPFRRTQAYALLATRRVFEVLRGSAFYDEVDLTLRQLQQVAQRPTRSGPRGEAPHPRFEERFLYLAELPHSYTLRSEESDALLQAAAELRVVRFRYKDGEQVQEVSCHPYAIVIHRGAIHCIGHHVERGEVSVFAFHRMSRLIPDADERFSLPADFDVEEYLQGDFGVEAITAPEHALVEFDARVADEVRSKKVHPRQRIAVAPDGRVRVSFPYQTSEPVVRWVLGFGDAARVVNPPSLVSAVRDALANAAQKYTS